MQDPQPAAPASEALSWQFIVLVIAMALLVPLVTAVPVNIERGAQRPLDDERAAALEQPDMGATAASGQPDTGAAPGAPAASLTDLELDTTYETATGITVTYPAGWNVTETNNGAFVMTNYAEGAQRTPAAANELAIVGQVLPTETLLANWQLEYETVPAPVEILGAQATAAGVDESNLSEITIDGYPAAQTHFTEQGEEIMVILAAPNENRMLLIQAIALEGQWDAVNSAMSQILDGMSLNIPAS